MVAAELTSHAFLCTLQRDDGVGVLVTDHDGCLGANGADALGSCDFRSIDVVQQSTLLGSGAKLQLAHGSRASAALTAVLNRSASASIALEGVDWSDSSSRYQVCSGQITSVSRGEAALMLNVVTTPPALGDQPGIETSPECRATLGDQRCRVGMRSRSLRLKVVAAESSRISFDRGELSKFSFGRLQWVTGANSGLSQDILQASDNDLILREAPRHSPRFGDAVRVFEGCDRRFETCRDRFDNAANFRGEPHLPGTDFLLRYPGD